MALLTDVLKKAKQNTTSQATPVKPTAIKPATPAPKPIVTDVNAETQMRPPAQPQPVALNSNVQKPQTEEEALAAGGGYNKSLAEFYKDKGLNFDTSKMSGSFDEEAQKFLDTQAEQKTELDKQVMDAKSKAARFLEQNVAATKNQFAQSREGAMSAGNTLAGQNIVKNYQSGYQRDLDSINQKKKQLEDLQAQQQETFVAGRADSIRGMQKQIAEAEANLAKTQQENQKQTMDIIGMLNTSGALANMSPEDIQYMQQALPDAPPGVLQLFSSAATKKSLNEQRKTQFDNQISAINTMKGLVSEGINLTPDMMMSMSKQTGLPVESIMSFNQQALAISNDKSLDSLTKLANLKKVGNELDLEHRGIYTEEAKNIDYIKQLYQKGDIETAHLMERKLGVDDLSYQANLQLKQAQATIEQARSQGRALTPQDMSALADAQAKMADLNPGSYQGNTSLVATAHSYINTGGWKEAFKNNKVLQNGELGCAYVASDILKQAGLLDKNYNSIAQMVPALEAKGWTLHDTPSPGDVVVWGPMQGTDGHGHIGVVSGPNSAVNNQGPTGPADTPIFTGRPIVGFYAPPREKGLNGMSDSDILAAYESAGKIPTAPSEARKLINTARQTGYVPSGGAKADQTAFNQENTIRDEFTKNTQNFVKIRDSYNTIQSAAKDPTAAGDLSLIFAYMKILDPGSTVREGEFANAQNAASVPTQIQNVWNKAQTGQRLSSEQRKDFLDQADKLYNSQKSSYDRQVDNTKKLAESYGLNANRVVYDFANPDANLGGAQKIVDSYQDYSIPETHPDHIISLDNL